MVSVKTGVCSGTEKNLPKWQFHSILKMFICGNWKTNWHGYVIGQRNRKGIYNYNGR